MGARGAGGGRSGVGGAEPVFIMVRATATSVRAVDDERDGGGSDRGGVV